MILSNSFRNSYQPSIRLQIIWIYKSRIWFWITHKSWYAINIIQLTNEQTVERAYSSREKSWILNFTFLMWSIIHCIFSMSLKPTLGEWKLTFRKAIRDQVIILYICHTRLTHSFKLKQEEQTECIVCYKSYIVWHFLIECCVLALITLLYIQTRGTTTVYIGCVVE